MNDQQHCLLRFLSGPLAGQVYLFEHGTISIGRSPEASITIADDTLSRIHAELAYNRSVDSWSLEDKNSHNGTWSHGRQITKLIILSNHQRIRLGNSLFEVEYKNVEEHIPGLDHKTVHFSPDEFAEFSQFAQKQEKEDTPIDPIFEEHRQMSIIYKAQLFFAKLGNEKSIHQALFQTIFEELPVDDLYHLSYDGQDDDFQITRGQDSHGNAIHTQSIPISDEVLDYISIHKDSLLVNDPDTCETIRRSHHVLCVPIMDQDELIGAIYAISFSQSEGFSDNDLNLLSGLVHGASFPIINCRLQRQNVINERMAALGTTAASLSHYIKNILSSIDGSMYLLNSGIEDSDKELSLEAYNILGSNHQRLSSLVMDLLNLAKEDALEFHAVNLSEIVFEVSELVQQKIEQKNIELCIDQKFTSQPAIAELDSSAIHRVILGLLSNAIDAVITKHSNNNTGKISVSFDINQVHHTLSLYITDNGCGIRPEELKQIFDMFYSTKKDRGTGLGLAVAKRLVKAHGGIILAESDLLKNETLFTIKLPLTRESTKLISQTK